MGTRLIIDGTNEIGYFVGGSVAGLTALHLVDTDVAKSTRNFIRGGAGAVFTGVPDFSSGPPVLGNREVHLTLGALEEAHVTDFFVARRTAAGAFDFINGPNISTPPAPYTGGMYAYNLSYDDTNKRVSATAMYVGSDNAITNAGSGNLSIDLSDGAWRLFALRLGATKLKIWNLTNGTTKESADYTGKVRLPAPSAPMLGWNRFAALTGKFQLSSYWHYSRALSDAEVAQVAAEIRAREARHGRIV